MKELRHESVGLLVAEQPLRAAIFDRFGIDYCCAGRQTLLEACAKSRIDPEIVIESLLANDANATSQDAPESWLNSSITELIDHIQQTHHAYLKLELPRLQLLAEKVALVHGTKDPRLLKVASIFSKMKEEIEQHTEKEDRILFPWMRQIDRGRPLSEASFGAIANPIRRMDADHNEAGEALMKLRELTDQYTAPASACTSWTALLAGFARLDQDLRTHIHKENSILFPKAIKKESAYALCQTIT